ncbi:TPA: HAD family hydrolase [archaeon]|nr:HAD family hydrolase [Candidatus Naiadarchaeales archaeon SRR2090153.bin461]
MKPYLIFDYDGVIADSKEAWFYSFKKTLENLGHNNIDVGDFLKHAGPKTEATIESFLPQKDKHRAHEGKEIIDKIVAKEGVEKMRLCSNVKETLVELKKLGYKMSLLTNSDSAFVYPGLKKFGLDKEIWDFVITADDPFPTKEKAIAFIAASNQISASGCVYIADRAGDVKVARNAGTKMIAISNETAWETENRMKEANPDIIVKDLSELPAALEKLFKQA